MDACLCPLCGVFSPFQFTGKWVQRGIVWWGEVDQDHQNIRIPLARCQNCKSCPRVLPQEILPRKTFSLPVMEKSCRAYVFSLKEGLRQVVNRMGRHHPNHSTLHRWLSGLGEKILDRLESPVPTSALIAETARRLGPPPKDLRQRHFLIPFWKYKTDRRRDQLVAVARLLFVASLLFPKSSTPLTEWQGWLIPRFHVAVWAFPTGEINTPMQLTLHQRRGVRDSRRSKNKKGDP